MPVNKVAENVLGTIGTILWTCQLIPQVWKSWREKSTEGLSSWLMLIWVFGDWFLGVYVIVQDINIPLIIQPQLFGTLAAVSWAQCLYYGHKRSLRFCVVAFTIVMVAFGALETGVSIAMKGHSGPGLRFFGVFSAVMISLGLVPQYVEIWRRKEVIGISMLFLAIDMSGGLFSVLSLVFKPTFDVVAALTYLAVIVFDGVIVAAALILNPRAKKRRARLAETPDASEGSPPPSEPSNVEKPNNQDSTRLQPSDALHTAAIV